MGEESIFHFKQFEVQNKNSAMKVGTDGVLLGAWTEIQEHKQILDIGTGTGVIALIIAQRNPTAIIDAVEIDQYSFEEASSNFKSSPWTKRLICHKMSFQQYAVWSKKRYDLIVSNPPFFRNSLKAPRLRRSNARHEDQLPFGELISGVVHLLTEDGIFSLILPVTEADSFCGLATQAGLYLIRNTEVFPNRMKKSHRQLMEFSKIAGSTKNDALYIEQKERGNYSEEYIRLTSPFYLHF